MALILITALLIAVAAVAVIALTAVRVTGERYQNGPAQSVGARADVAIGPRSV